MVWNNYNYNVIEITPNHKSSKYCELKLSMNILINQQLFICRNLLGMLATLC